MFISEIQVGNYKCFSRPVSLSLSRGLNLIVGKNNAGKTALLEALSLQFIGNPYISLETFPTSTQPPTSLSIVRVVLSFSKDELFELLEGAAHEGNTPFNIPISKDYLREEDLVDPANSAKSAEAFRSAVGVMLAKRYFKAKEFTFKLQREARGDGEHSARWTTLPDTYVSPNLERAETNNGRTQYYTQFLVNGPNPNAIQYLETRQVNSDGQKNDFILRAITELERITSRNGKYIYRFHAERTPVDSAPLTERRKLVGDGSNLAEVLHYHLSNLTLAKKYNKLVRAVLPDIHQVTVITETEKNAATASIRIWTNPRSVDKDWLARPLSDMGSGVAQVLAILYVLVFSTTPQLILMDEPQSFLHPDASRKLIELLSVNGKDHQIVISTHIPSIVASAMPSNVVLVARNRGKTTLRQIDIKEIQNQRLLLGEIGARFSDIFGYDRILWVEGPTEEICFPMIVGKLLSQWDFGTAILSVHATGDFEQRKTKDVDRIVNIYEKLTSANGGMMPESVGYIFDSEERTKKAMAEKVKRFPSMRFTSKRMYESYLLYADAITETIKTLETDSTVTTETIDEWININRQKETYFKGLPLVTNDETWRDTIHAKRFLKALFDKFCTNPTNRNFKEGVHCVILTKWILDNDPERLKPLALEIDAVMKRT